MTFLIVFFLLAIIVSFFCSILESALLSIPNSFVEIKLHEKKKYSKNLKNLKSDIDKPLSAILTLNTFANTLGAAGVGAQAQIIWGDKIITIVSFILTFSILIFSEIIPKVLGVTYWRRLIPVVVPVIKWLTVIMFPIVKFSKLLTGLIKKNDKRSVFSRTDISNIAQLGMNEGSLKENEKDVIQNLLKLNKMRVKEIMTPRTVLLGAEEQQTIKAFFDENPNIVFRRIPLYKEKLDAISGYFLKDDLLESIISNQGDKTLYTIKREISIIYENSQVIELFHLLIKKNDHIALVVDEYGVTAGIVTIEDVVETLLGEEIMDETDDVEDMQVLAKTRWKNKVNNLFFNFF